MKFLNFVWPHNRLLKRDGDEFARQEVNYIRSFGNPNFHQVHLANIPKDKFWERRQFALQFISASPLKYFDRISFFCHGWPKKIDAGFDLNTVDLLGRVLKKHAADGCRINLFCCKTGKLGEGFAAKLSDSAEMPVLAHSTSGHTTRNPNKWIFERDDYSRLENFDKKRKLSDIEYFQKLEQNIENYLYF